MFLTLKTDLSLAVGNDTLPRETFAAALDGRTGGNKDTRIFLRADKAVGYGDLMEVMNLLRGAGYLKIALVGLETVPPGRYACAGRDRAMTAAAVSPSLELSAPRLGANRALGHRCRGDCRASPCGGLCGCRQCARRSRMAERLRR